MIILLLNCSTKILVSTLLDASFTSANVCCSLDLASEEASITPKTFPL